MQRVPRGEGGGFVSGTDALGRVLTVPQLARIFGWSRRSALRTLLAMHARDRDNGLGGWLFQRPGSDTPIRKRLLVNEAMFREQHPELSAKAKSTGPDPRLRGELQSVLEDMASMRVRAAETRQQLNAHGSRIRNVEQRIGAIEQRLKLGT